MASKGQKFKKYDLDFKYKVVEEKLKGKAYSYLSKKYNIPEGTIYTWVHRLKHDGALGIKPRGRRKEGHIDYKERYEILKKFQDFLVVNTQNKK